MVAAVQTLGATDGKGQIGAAKILSNLKKVRASKC